MNAIGPGASRRVLRVSLRMMMAAILVFAVAVGWVVNRAQRQAETARIVRDLGGKVRYDWEHAEARLSPDAGPRWLTDRLGPDYNHAITEVDVTSSNRVDDAMASRFGQLAELDSLRIGPSPNFTDAGLSRLSGLKDMVILGINFTGATGAGFVHLQGMSRLRMLFAIGIPIKDADLAHLSGLTELDTLKIQGDEITDAGLAHLKPLAKLKMLTITTKRLMRITSAGLANLSAMAPLYELFLQASDVESLEPLRGKTSLKAIFISNARIDNEGLKALADLPGLGRLALTGKDQRFDDEGMIHFSGLSSLTSLWLSDTRVGDAGLEHLAGLSKLTELNLDGTRVTDAGLKHLVKLPLKSLSLNRTAITDDGLERIAGCQEIQLAETRVTEAGIEKLKVKFTGIRIVR